MAAQSGSRASERGTQKRERKRAKERRGGGTSSRGKKMERTEFKEGGVS